MRKRHKTKQKIFTAGRGGRWEYLSLSEYLAEERKIFEGEIDEICRREALKDYCNIHNYDFIEVNRWGEPLVKIAEF